MIMRPFPAAVIALTCALTAPVCFASPDSVVVFNEIHYNPAGPSEDGEWIELFNQMGIKVDISGWRIDGIGYQFEAGTIMEPGSYLVVAKTPVEGQKGPFTGGIRNSGQLLRLINQGDRVMDELDFQDADPWPESADGSGSTLAKILPYTASNFHAHWTVSAQTGGTPGTVNFPGAGGPLPTTTETVIPLNQTWRYNQSGVDLGGSWAASFHAVGGNWASGPGALAYETTPTVTIGTPLTFPGSNNPYVITYYFETEFNVTPAQLARLQALKIRHAVDDGVVYYLNGKPLHRVNMPAGDITAATLATANIEAGTTLSAPIPVPSTDLVAGANRLSAEVHQVLAGNSDIVFGLELDVETTLEQPGARPAIRFNEIPGSDAASFWVELTNTGTAALPTGGLILSADGDPQREYILPAGSLEPGGVLLLNQATLGFRPLEGEKLFLFPAGKTSVIDARVQTGRLRGLAAGKGDTWLYPSQATPGAPNVFVFTDSVVISEIQYNPPAIPAVPEVPATYQVTPLLAYGDLWRYNSANDNLPAGWASSEHAVGGNWRSGAGPLGVESSVLPVALGTVIAPYAAATVTYYFEREFTVTAEQLAAADSIEITHMIDDGAVFYLNGTELPRVGMPAGLINPETFASVGVDNASPGSLVFSPSALQAGTNRISVEVHQNSVSSSDLVFGMKMEARVQLTPGVPGTPLSNSENQWVEIANRSNAPVNLTGWDFGDGIDFVFPQGATLNPGEHACVVADASLFAAAYPGARMLGTYSGSLSRSGEHLVLRDQRRNIVDEVRYFDGGQWPVFADGGGSSLELRDLDADGMAGGSWAASDETGRSAWKTYTYRGVAGASLGPDTQWAELNLGMLSAGEIWIDDISVVELPDTTKLQKLRDTTFDNATAWRLRGNHRHSAVIPEPGNTGNKILRVVASGPTEHMHNQIETTLLTPVVNGREYEISFRARWITGSNQLHSRLYFNRLARVNVIDRPVDTGTPSAPNSTAAANTGPSYAALKHAPAVPAVSQAVTVSASASDPDGVAAMTLFYSVNGGAWQNTAMALTSPGHYEGSVPGQTAGAVVQFYIRGTDSAGAESFYPAAGPDSRALFKVNDNTAATNGLHNFRIITTNADRDFMHTLTEVMSNDRTEATVIDREGDIYYGAEVRLKSSQRGRFNPSRVGYNLSFPPDALFRGVHGGVAVDRSEGQAPGQRELLFDMMISNSGGPVSRYYDLIKVLAPSSNLTGAAVLQMARYDDVFLDSQFDNGSDGMMYEYELVYYPTSANAAGAKLPQPDNVVGVTVSNLGDDKERYRWYFLNKINREADDFAPIMNYAKTFSKTGDAFEADVNKYVDVDVWLRGMAYGVLSGAGDNAAANDQHNGIYYSRPDGRVIFLPHDMDFSFDAARTIFANSQLNALVAKPERLRLYLGHLQDIIKTTYHQAYMSIWTGHFAALAPGQDWAAELSYMTSRSNNVLSQINARIPSVTFAISTPGPVAVTNGTATLTGTGWVDIRGIRVAGNPEFLPVAWTGNTAWQLILPAPAGLSTLTLEAVDFSGKVIKTATIQLNNTNNVVPASAENLVVSELMYHPANPTNAETQAGFADSELFEYAEVMNISNSTLNLSGVRFTGGIDFDFPQGTTLPAGQRLIAAKNREAFLKRYPAVSASLAPGSFLNDTQLSNSGEKITLINGTGAVLREFEYSDNFPWPPSADGTGLSLTLIAPLSNPDHTLPQNWRAGMVPGGSPGTVDGTPFTGNPATDDDRDGLSALMEYAFGTSDSVSNMAAAAVSTGTDGRLTYIYTRQYAADDVIIEVEGSASLGEWTPLPGEVIAESVSLNGTSEVTWRSSDALPAGRYFTRLRVHLR